MREVAIIGAGPAGCVAAILLARGGSAVHLLEQHTFPRDKVCGECVSPLGIDVLNRLGVAARIAELKPAIFERSVLYAADSHPLEVQLPRPMWGVSRASLDAILLDEARAAGAVIRQPTRCEQLIPGSRPQVRWRCLRNNDEHEQTCDWALVADGKGALPTGVPTATSDLGIKAHFANVNGPRDAIELFGVKGHYGGLAAVEGSRWNVAFSVPVDRVRESGGNIELMFQAIARENSTLRDRLRRANRVSRWLAAPLPRFSVLPEWSEHVILLGNAAAALEPVGGEGIGLAMRSAELAAGALLAHDAELKIARLPQTFSRLWRTRSWTCRLVSRILSAPALAEAAAPLAAANGGLVSAALNLMGKA